MPALALNKKLAVAAPGSGIETTLDCPIVLLLIVVLNAPPALIAAKIKLPFAAVAGKDVNVPAVPLAPAKRFPKLVAAPAVSSIVPAVSTNFAKRLATTAEPAMTTLVLVASEGR